MRILLDQTHVDLRVLIADADNFKTDILNKWIRVIRPAPPRTRHHGDMSPAFQFLAQIQSQVKIHADRERARAIQLEARKINIRHVSHQLHRVVLHNFHI